MSPFTPLLAGAAAVIGGSWLWKRLSGAQEPPAVDDEPQAPSGVLIGASGAPIGAESAGWSGAIFDVTQPIMGETPAPSGGQRQNADFEPSPTVHPAYGDPMTGNTADYNRNPAPSRSALESRSPVAAPPSSYRPIPHVQPRQAPAPAPTPSRIVKIPGDPTRR